MKKFFVFALVLTSVVLISGCSFGNKKLTCSSSVAKSDIGEVHNDMIITYSGKKLVKIETVTEMTLNDANKEKINSFYNSFVDSTNDLKDKKGVKVTNSKDSSTITSSVEYTVNKVDDEARKTIGLTKEDNLDSVRSDLESIGYSCK